MVGKLEYCFPYWGKRILFFRGYILFTPANNERMSTDKSNVSYQGGPPLDLFVEQVSLVLFWASVTPASKKMKSNLPQKKLGAKSTKKVANGFFSLCQRVFQGRAVSPPDSDFNSAATNLVQVAADSVHKVDEALFSGPQSSHNAGLLHLIFSSSFQHTIFAWKSLQSLFL